MADLRTYIDILNPWRFKETIEKEAKKEEPVFTAVNIVISAVIGLASSFFTYYVRDQHMGIYALSRAQPASPFSFLTSYNPLSTPIGVVLTFIASIILFYLGSFLLNLVARWLGGKGSYKNLLWPLSVLRVVFGLLALPMIAAYGISIFAVCIWGLPALAISFFSLYLHYKVLRAVHPELTMWRAIAAYIIYIVLLMVIEAIYLAIRFALHI